jgi:hypothetical protein
MIQPPSLAISLKATMARDFVRSIASSAKSVPEVGEKNS